MTRPPDPREVIATGPSSWGSFAAAMRLDATEDSAQPALEPGATTGASPPSSTLPEPPMAIEGTPEGPPSEVESPSPPEAPPSSTPADAPLEAAQPRRTTAAARRARPTPAATARAVRTTREGLIVTPQALLLGLVGTLFILMFTLIEPSPRWAVLLGTAATTFGLEGVLRSGRRQAFAEGGLDTAPFLLLPALYMLIVPVFIEHATLGFATPASAALAGFGYGALVIGTLSSVREFDPARERGRLIAASATYFVAFALFALIFLFGIGQRPATVAVALASIILAAEILREGEIDPAETLLYSVVVGIVVGETRWVLHYLPIDAYAGALTLLLAFYVATGLLHSYVVRALTRDVARTYASVGVAGIAFIAAARAVGLA